MTAVLDPADHPHRRRTLPAGEWVLVSPRRARRLWQGDEAPPAPPAPPRGTVAAIMVATAAAGAGPL